jgi:hypothetical protein
VCILVIWLGQLSARNGTGTVEVIKEEVKMIG